MAQCLEILQSTHSQTHEDRKVNMAQAVLLSGRFTSVWKYCKVHTVRLIKIVRLIWHRLYYCLGELQKSYSVSSVSRGTGYKYQCLEELPRRYNSAHADPKSNTAQAVPVSGKLQRTCSPAHADLWFHVAQVTSTSS